MKKIALATVLFSSMASAQVAEYCVYNTGQVAYVPSGWYVDYIPEGRNNAPKNRFYNPEGKPANGFPGAPDLQPADPCANNKCKRQREVFDKEPVLVIGPGG